MAVLKKIKFGTGTATPIAKTVLTAKSGGVMSVAAPNGVTNDIDENVDYQYELDVNVDNATIVKSSGSLAVGTVPAAQVSVAAGGHTADTEDGKTFVGDDVEEVLLELNGKIAAVGGEAKSYKIVEVANPANTSLAEYKIQEQIGTGSWGDVTGSSTIVVPKDNAFVTAQLGHDGATADASTGTITDGSGEDALLIEYVNGSGVYTLVAVPIGAFLKEAEFKDGLAVNASGEVSAKLGQGLEFGGETGENQSIKVKIDSTSEKDSQATPVDFLTVGSGGVKVQGIKDEIDRKINALDVTTDAAVAGQYVAAIEENNGLVAVKTRANVSEAVLNNYAKGSDATAVAATDTVNQAISKLENQVDAAKTAASTGITTAIEALDNPDTAAAGQVVTAVSTADGIATPTKADLAGITLGGFNADTTATGAISSSDTLGAAINKLQNQISAASDDHTVVEHASGNTHVTVSGASNANGSMTYTVTESDIASAQGLAGEITRAQTAEGAIDTAVGLTKASGSETRSFTPTTNYGTVSGTAATTVMGNMQNIDTALNTLSTTVGNISYSVSGTELTFYGIPAHS